MSEDTNSVAPRYTPTTGNTIGTSNDAPRSAYAQRIMPIPPVPMEQPMQGALNVAPLQPAQQAAKID